MWLSGLISGLDCQTLIPGEIDIESPGLANMHAENTRNTFEYVFDVCVYVRIYVRDRSCLCFCCVCACIGVHVCVSVCSCLCKSVFAFVLLLVCARFCVCFRFT